MKDPAAKIMLGLTEALVLESLRREPTHGYGLMKELEETFGETPNRNRIYPLLGRLEEEGYVEGRTDPDSSRGKTTYHLTDAGRDRLETYESMPPSFREALDRFWGAPGAADGDDDASRPDDEGPEPEDPGEGPEGGDQGDVHGDDDPEHEDREEAPEGPADEGSPGPGDRAEDSQGSPGDGAGDGGRSGDGGDGGAGGGPGGGGDPGGDRGSDGGEGGGMDLRRNPETGEVEMVIRGTHWGEVRIELGELRDDD